MKFEEYPVKIDSHGIPFAKEDDIMIGRTEQPCLNCGKPTKYIELTSEGHFCSDECVDEFYRNLFATLNVREEIT